MGINAAVGAVSKLHASLHSLHKSHTLDIGGLSIFTQIFFGPALFGANVVYIVAIIDIHDKPCAACLRHRQRVIINKAGVFNRTDARPDRVFYADGAMGVGGYEHPLCPCGFHNGAQLVFGHFWFTGLSANGEHGAGSDRFDEVRTLCDQKGSFRCGFFRRAGHAKAHIGRKLIIGDDAVQFPAAFWNSDICASDKHARARDMPRIYGVPQRNVGQATIGADVTHSCEASF